MDTAALRTQRASRGRDRLALRQRAGTKPPSGAKFLRRNEDGDEIYDHCGNDWIIPSDFDTDNEVECEVECLSETDSFPLDDPNGAVGARPAAIASNTPLPRRGGNSG